MDEKTLNAYAAEAENRWKDTDAYREYTEKTANFKKSDFETAAIKLNSIFLEFADCLKNGISPEKKAPQSLVIKLKSHISENYYTCTDEILSHLGDMYVCDPRFKSNIDKNTPGNAEYIKRAIDIYRGK